MSNTYHELKSRFYGRWELDSYDCSPSKGKIINRFRTNQNYNLRFRHSYFLRNEVGNLLNQYTVSATATRNNTPLIYLSTEETLKTFKRDT